MSPRKSFVRTPVFVAALTATWLLVMAVTSAAAQIATGRITGRVTDRATGLALAGMRVAILDQSGERSVVTTDTAGVYVSGDLTPGTYLVWFSDPDNNYLTQYYDGAAGFLNATEVIVTTGGLISGIDAALMPWGRITGTVTAQASGAPLPGIQVALYGLNGRNGWDQQRVTTSDSHGGYDFGGLSTAAYRLSFFDPNRQYQTSFYTGAADIASATSVSVTIGHTTAGINAALLELEHGRITGTVIAGATGQPLAGIQVAFYTTTSWYDPAVATVTSGADGGYDSGRLETGLYRVGFSTPDGAYPPQFYDHADFIWSASPVTVTAAHTSNINVALLDWGGIIGRVADQVSGLPLANIHISLQLCEWYQSSRGWRWECWERATASTNSDGSYEFRHLSSNTYYAMFSDPSGIHVSKSYSSSIGVTLGQVVEGIDVTLVTVESLTGHITGAITAQRTGIPLANVSVSALRYNGWAWETINNATTGMDGAYDVAGLSPGIYRVGFWDPAGRFEGEFFDHATSVETGANVHVAAATMTSNVSAGLLERGRITGSVTDQATRKPLPGITVIFDLPGGPWGESSTGTDANGRYDSGPLVVGVYQVWFRDDSGAYLQQNTTATVVNEHETSGIDAVLIRLGRITGRVTARATGKPLAGITVIFDLPGGPWGESSTGTDANGHYDSGPLAAGVYQVWFRDDSGTYEQQSATATVVNEHETPGIDAVLIRLGRITGRVTARATGKPLAGITVGFWQGGEWRKASTSTDDEGVYDSGPLPTGVYRVWFSNADDEYQLQVYPHARSIEAGADVTVAAERETSGIDGALIALGGITGRVTDQATGNPLPGIRVQASPTTPTSGQGTTVTDADGLYEIADLSSGLYRVQYTDPSAKYLTEFYDDAPSQAAGVDVRVLAPHVTTGINAALGESARNHITGRVTAQATGVPLPGIQVGIYQQINQYRNPLRTVVTSADGSYDSGKLVDGVYRVGFLDPSRHYSNEYYANAWNLDSGADINLTGGQIRAGIDAALALPGRITGTVTAQATGAPLPNIRVWIYQSRTRASGNAYWNLLRSVVTAADGSYDSGQLFDGVYLVAFSDISSHYVSEYYDDHAAMASGDAITLVDGQIVSGIDAGLATSGRITGTVTDRITGAPAAAVPVSIFFSSSSGPWWMTPRVTTETNAEGIYDVGNLPAGSYRIMFFGARRYLTDNYYDVRVAAGQVTENVNIALTPWGQIAGTVTDQRTGQPLPDIWVFPWYLSNSSGREWWRRGNSVTTRADGTYTFFNDSTGGLLDAGAYRLEFYDPAARYHTEFYEDAPDWESSQVVTFTLGQAVSDIDVALAPRDDPPTPTPTPTATPPPGQGGRAYLPVISRQDASTPAPTVTPTSTPTGTALEAPQPSQIRRVHLPVVLR